MFELSACIEWLFAEGDTSFAERVHRAAAAGLPCVEFWTWRDKDLSAVASALRDSEVRLTSFVSEPTGRLVDPHTHDAFITGVAESAEAAATLGCRSLIVLAGGRIRDATEHDQRSAIVAALQRAAPVAAMHGVTLLLEPINTRLEDPSYFLDSTREGLAIVEDVSMPNVRLLYDLYHSVVMGEQPEEVVGDRMHLVGHVHLADVPGRHEPGTGAISWQATIKWLYRSGYTGKLGLEYMPSGGTSESLSLIKSLNNGR
jgi:hydroxypyruvate isomerase